MIWALGMGSAFLPWCVVESGPFDVGMDMFTILGGGTVWDPSCAAPIILYLVATMLTLVWDKAFALQLVALSLLLPGLGTLGGAFTTTGGALDVLLAFAATLGPGTYLGWTAGLSGLYLHGQLRSGGLRRSRMMATVAERTAWSFRPRQPGTIEDTVALSPNDVQRTVYADEMVQGNAAAARGDTIAALRHFGRAMGSCHDSHRRAECKLRIALLLYGMGELEEAHLFVQEAKKLDPGVLSRDGGGGRLLPARKIPRTK